MLQRQFSLERDEPEAGMEALEEPLKAKKRRESRQGIRVLRFTKFLLVAELRSTSGLLYWLKGLLKIRTSETVDGLLKMTFGHRQQSQPWTAPYIVFWKHKTFWSSLKLYKYSFGFKEVTEWRWNSKQIYKWTQFIRPLFEPQYSYSKIFFLVYCSNCTILPIKSNTNFLKLWDQ